MPENDPKHIDEALGKILAEIQGLKLEWNSRHSLVADQVGALIARMARVEELALEAKRVADAAAHEVHSTSNSLIEHTRGLSSTQAEQVKQIASLSAEMGSQTLTLKKLELVDALVADSVERKPREDERLKIDLARWSWIKRAVLIGTPIAGALGYLIGHWRP